MRFRKCFTLCLALVLVCALAGCSKDSAGVYVQSVKDLANFGGLSAHDRFGGLVVSENVAEIQKDSDKTVAKLLVREGDDVTEGQELFSYDTDQLQLNLDKQRLELEQLQATIENYRSQIADLEKDQKKASANNKLQYTIQIQSLQVDLKEAELNLTAKEKEVAQSENILENAVVYAPVTGRVQAISENGYDNYGNPLPYITIQQVGSYRIKGTVGELQLGQIMEGTRLKITSRTDENIIWYGTVSFIDYENPTQGNDYDMYYGSSVDEMSSSSKYPFYIELNNTDGLLLGQHVYLELDIGTEESTGLSIGSAFIVFDEDGSTFVWAENKNKLEKRTVVLGEYNMMNDAYEILEGLTEADFIAFPDWELCYPGAATTHSEPAMDAGMEGEVA